MNVLFWLMSVGNHGNTHASQGISIHARQIGYCPGLIQTGQTDRVKDSTADLEVVVRVVELQVRVLYAGHHW